MKIKNNLEKKAKNNKKKTNYKKKKNKQIKNNLKKNLRNKINQITIYKIKLIPKIIMIFKNLLNNILKIREVVFQS